MDISKVLLGRSTVRKVQKGQAGKTVGTTKDLLCIHCAAIKYLMNRKPSFVRESTSVSAAKLEEF